MAMPGRNGYAVSGGWANSTMKVNGQTFPADISITTRTNNTPPEYTAANSISFTGEYEDGGTDEYIAYIINPNNLQSSSPADNSSDANSNVTGSSNNWYRYGFNGKEKDNDIYGEGNAYDFGARIYDGRLGCWLSVDPLYKKYPNFSPYVFVANNPINAIDAKGKDIIFLLDREAANGNGHLAVLIGNEKAGWVYVSMNGTGKGEPWGDSKYPDVGTPIVDEKGKKILDPKSAILRANTINPKENKHKYNENVRIETSDSEDKNALKKAKDVASKKNYGIAGPGVVSCIDVGQAAFASVVKDRNLEGTYNFDYTTAGETDLIPKHWFDDLPKNIKEQNKNAEYNNVSPKNKIKIIPPKKDETQKTSN